MPGSENVAGRDAPWDPRVDVVKDLEEIATAGSFRAHVEKQFDTVENRAGSQQIPGTVEQFRSSISGAIEPPIDLRLWASQLARNTRLNRGIRTIARNTVGLGWEVIPREDLSDEEKESAKDNSRRVSEFFRNVNPTKPFVKLMECVVIDEEATGNGYLEWTRTGDGSLDKAFHVQSITLRVLDDERGYVQERGQHRRYFKNFGEEKVMDAVTGDFEGDPRFGEGIEDDILPADRRATEIMHFMIYHPMSEFYGLPRYISAAAAIAGNFHSAKRNLVFFIHDAVPRAALMISGGKLSSQSKDDLAAYFDEGRGSDQAHRILILEAESEGVGVDEKNSTKIDLKPFTVGVTEDGSFLNYRVQNDEEIREALGLSEVFFKSVKLTKASAVVAKATTDEQEFEPARKDKEFVFNNMIVQAANGLNAPNVVLRFSRPATTDPVEKAQVDRMYSMIGAKTPNEIRLSLGKDPLPPAEKWANVPLPVALLGLEGKAVDFTTLKTEPVEPQQPAVGPEGDNNPDDSEEEDGPPEEESPDEDSSNGNSDGNKEERTLDFIERSLSNFLPDKVSCVTKGQG